VTIDKVVNKVVVEAPPKLEVPVYRYSRRGSDSEDEEDGNRDVDERHRRHQRERERDDVETTTRVKEYRTSSYRERDRERDRGESDGVRERDRGERTEEQSRKRQLPLPSSTDYPRRGGRPPFSSSSQPFAKRRREDLDQFSVSMSRFAPLLFCYSFVLFS